MGQVDLTEIHEGEHSFQVFELDAAQVDQRVAVLDILQDSPEEIGAGGQDHLVHLDLLVGTDERQVGEIFVLLQVVERVDKVGSKVVPVKA